MGFVELELPSTPPAPQDTITCRQLLAFGLLTEEEVLDGYQTRQLETFRWAGLGAENARLERAELPVTPYSPGTVTGVGINIRSAGMEGILFLKRQVLCLVHETKPTQLERAARLLFPVIAAKADAEQGEDDDVTQAQLLTVISNQARYIESLQVQLGMEPQGLDFAEPAPLPDPRQTGAGTFQNYGRRGFLGLLQKWANNGEPIDRVAELLCSDYHLTQSEACCLLATDTQLEKYKTERPKRDTIKKRYSAFVKNKQEED